jgi:hypothetical protein
MNGNEIQRLAHAISMHRPDWMISSLTTFITRNLSHWTYRDASVALTWVATDSKPDGSPASETPKRVLEQGPWRQAAAVGGVNTYVRPPRKDEACATCGGICPGVCVRDQYGTDDEPVTDEDRRLVETIRARREGKL